MQNLSKIETVEQARDVLLEMDEDQEITAESDEETAVFRKHNDQEFNVVYTDYESGIVSLKHASHILARYGDHDLSLS